MFKIEYKLRDIKDDDWKIWKDDSVYFKNRQIKQIFNEQEIKIKIIYLKNKYPMYLFNISKK